MTIDVQRSDNKETPKDNYFELVVATQCNSLLWFVLSSQSLLKVAQGSAEAYFENNIMIWDVAAGLAIVEGAGGEFRINKQELYYYVTLLSDI